MRVFSFISSVIAFAVTLFYLIADFPNLNDLDGIIYFSLMIILLLICATGIFINIPVINRIHSKLKGIYR